MHVSFAHWHVTTLAPLYLWFRAVVVKTIRLYDGVPSPAHDSSGVDIVHLVRDPRAVVQSQMKLWKTTKDPAAYGQQ